MEAGMPKLRPPSNQVELAALHDLRDSVLFMGRGRSGYDRHHPDDQSPNNHFMGFWQDGELLGTLRVDLMDSETAALRLVAVAPHLQRTRNRSQDGHCCRKIHFGGGLLPSRY